MSCNEEASNLRKELSNLPPIDLGARKLETGVMNLFCELMRHGLLVEDIPELEL